MLGGNGMVFVLKALSYRCDSAFGFVIGLCFRQIYDTACSYGSPHPLLCLVSYLLYDTDSGFVSVFIVLVSSRFDVCF